MALGEDMTHLDQGMALREHRCNLIDAGDESAPDTEDMHWDMTGFCFLCFKNLTAMLQAGAHVGRPEHRELVAKAVLVACKSAGAQDPEILQLVLSVSILQYQVALQRRCVTHSYAHHKS